MQSAFELLFSKGFGTEFSLELLKFLFLPKLLTGGISFPSQIDNKVDQQAKPKNDHYKWEATVNGHNLNPSRAT
jgi:hypothetical protein